MTRSPAIRTLVLALALCAAAVPAHALRADLDSREFTGHVMAPDWVWQGRDLTVMVRLLPKAASDDSPGGVPAPMLAEPPNPDHPVQIRLELSEKARAHFGRDGAPHDWTEQELSREINPYSPLGGQFAFSGITVLSDAPVGDYNLQLHVGDFDPIPLRVRVIPGQVIRGGPFMAVAVPAGIALVWCAAFAFVFSRLSRPGAWLEPAEAAGEPGEQHAWMAEERVR